MGGSMAMGYPKMVGLCWFIMQNPIQVNDLGAPPISGHLHMGHISRVYKSTQEQLAKKRKNWIH